MVAHHRALYQAAEGFDASFGDLVGEILDEFIANHDPRHEAGWIADQGRDRLGSIFCTALDDKTAKLRLFLLTPDARGKGLARDMLRHCMSFAETRGYAGMQLRTHESHRAACALYLDFGWSLNLSKPVRSFGQDLVEQHWSYSFQGPCNPVARRLNPRQCRLSSVG